MNPGRYTPGKSGGKILADMENHTKRIRKARRQGLAGIGRNLAARSNRAALSPATRGEDLPGAPIPNARRRATVTKRKGKRQAARPVEKRGAQRSRSAK